MRASRGTRKETEVIMSVRGHALGDEKGDGGDDDVRGHTRRHMRA
jgi:hypothetical protein